MRDYHFYCFECGQSFYRKVDPKRLKPFANKYGEWMGIKCKCKGMAKHIGERTSIQPVEIFYNDGKNRKITKAHLEDIRSRAVTEDGTVLRGREGLKYNYSKGMKPAPLDVIN